MCWLLNCTGSISKRDLSYVGRNFSNIDIYILCDVKLCSMFSTHALILLNWNVWQERCYVSSLSKQSLEKTRPFCEDYDLLSYEECQIAMKCVSWKSPCLFVYISVNIIRLM